MGGKAVRRKQLWMLRWGIVMGLVASAVVGSGVVLRQPFLEVIALGSDRRRRESLRLDLFQPQTRKRNTAGTTEVILRAAFPNPLAGGARDWL